MQYTFVLGNGFDKAIGLRTGYWEFYQWYLRQPNESDDVALMKNEIKKCLNGEDSIWADFEIALGQFTNVITDKIRFIEVFEHARSALIRYLTTEYSQKTTENNDFLKSATYCLIRLSQKVTEGFPDDRKHLFCIEKDEKTTFNCITFNYTPVLRDGAKDLEDNAVGISNSHGWYGAYEIGKTLNVHGRLDDFPILGVDNPGQIANKEFRNDPDILQLMVKGEIDKKLGRKWRAEAQEIIRSSDKIYVYGASLGDTDEFWWRELARWFEEDADNHQLALYCHPKTDASKMKAEQDRFVRSISKHFTCVDYSANIVIDDKEKTMIVKFAYMSSKAEIKTSATATLSAVPAISLSVQG